MTGMTHHFLKMNGLGNDFVVLDLRREPLALTDALARAIANRETGIGCDQLITIEEPRNGGDAFMGIRNQDGGTVEACGNAARCIGKLILEETGKDAVIIETLGGNTVATRADAENITVDMGEPRLKWNEIPLSEEFQDTRGIELEVGPLLLQELSPGPDIKHRQRPALHIRHLAERIAALAVDPDAPELQRNLGLFLLRAGRLETGSVLLRLVDRGVGTTSLIVRAILRRLVG